MTKQETTRIKLIWDFRGAEAEGIAKHHIIHLKEFAESRKLANTMTGFSSLSPMHFIAYLVVEQTDMIMVRDALKPHRGETSE